MADDAIIILPTDKAEKTTGREAVEFSLEQVENSYAELREKADSRSDDYSFDTRANDFAYDAGGDDIWGL